MNGWRWGHGFSEPPCRHPGRAAKGSDDEIQSANNPNHDARMRVVRKLSAARRAAVLTDFNARGSSIASQLQAAGWRHVRERGDGAADWLRPGATSRRSATLSADGDSLFVWTATAAGFTAGAVHDKLQVYAALNHAGDVDAASAALLAEGYGA